MLTHLASAGGGGSDLVPLYYLVGIIGAILGGLMALNRYLARQRDRWVAEGRKEANLAEKLDSNTTAATKNTAAIEKLTSELRDFTIRTDSALEGHRQRIARLETRAGLRKLREPDTT